MPDILPRDFTTATHRALFSSFDTRRYLEDEIVAQLGELGTRAVASTSTMNTKTPVVREIFVKMVDDTDADAILLIQLSSLHSEGSLGDMNPQQSVIVRPTGYWNVFSVETTEYVEPQAAEFEHSLVLLTELFSAQTQQPVLGIQSHSEYSVAFDEAKDYSIIRNEAEAIVRHLSRDGLIAR